MRSLGSGRAPDVNVFVVIQLLLLRGRKQPNSLSVIYILQSQHIENVCVRKQHILSKAWRFAKLSDKYVGENDEN